MSPVREILNASALSRALTRIASEIVERNGGIADVALVGVRTRGVPLAERLAARLEKSEGVTVPVGILDITMYRDDLGTAGRPPAVQSTRIDFREEDKTIVLVDDVLFTGRTVRAALDALIDFGRPRRIQLAVLVDRGGRELPIAADYVGRAADVAADEHVQVQLKEIDGTDRVTIQPGRA
jgi:pyrimidine operon attenuation protein/uracil phosphoribosyltransferase